MPQNYPWFQANFAYLQAVFAQGKLAHGLLFGAPKGCGKGEFARFIAKSILCQNSKSSLQAACDNCRACKLVEAGVHPDLHLLSRLVDNKGKQKHAIGVEQVRDLTGKLAATAQFGGWRVAIVEAVELMTKAAFNAMLKTLEEPGRETLLMINSHRLQQVPATIRSRCQLQPIKLDAAQISPWLCAETGCEPQQAGEAIKACFGAPLAAREFIIKDTGERYLEVFKALDMMLRNRHTVNDFVESYGRDEQIWAWLADYFHQVQLACLSGPPGDDYAGVPRAFPSRIYARITAYLRGQSAGSNLQPQLQMQAVLIPWFELGRKIASNQ